MKKQFNLLVCGVVIAGFLLACKGPESPAATDVQQSTGSPRGEAASGPAEGPIGQVSTWGYRAYAQSLSEKAYKQDPIAIEGLVELNGACNGATSARVGAKVNADMARLQHFCEGYRPEASGKVDWSKSYSAVLSARLDAMRAEGGPGAVDRELARLLAGDMKPQEARDVLEYAARNDVVPAQLSAMIDEKIAGTSIQREQLEALAHIEFCRRGGDCGSSDFSTLVACVAIGPCQPGDGLLSVVRRKTSPQNFAAARAMSEALSRG